MKRIPVSCANPLVFNYLSATLRRGDSTATTLYQNIRKEALQGLGVLIGFGHERFENKLCPRLALSDKASAVTNHKCRK